MPTPTAASPSGPEPVAVDQAAASRTPAAAAHRDAAVAEAAPAAPAPARTGTPPVAFDADALMPGKVPHASPAVRLFARELGVDLAQVTGSARAGRISKLDVQAFVKQALAGGGAARAAGSRRLDLIPWPKVDFAKFGPVESKPLTRIQKLSGANLARNWAMIPHVTHHDHADITEMEAFRKRLGEENKDVKVTALVFLIKAVVAAL